VTLKKQRFLICVACTLMLFCNVGLSTNAFSAFSPFLIKEGLLTNSQSSFVITVRLFTGFISMMFVRSYLKIVGIRLGLTLAMLSSALSFFLFSVATGFYSHCFASVFAGICYGFGGSVASSILLHRWFDENLSTAVGICLAGTGAAIILAPPMITFLVETYSLRVAFVAVCVFVVLCTLVAAAIFRDRDTASGAVTEADDILLVPKSHYYALMITAFTLGIAAGPGFSHLAVLFTNVGFESMTVSYLVSIFGVTLMIGKFSSGALADMIGSKKTLSAFFVMLLIGGVGCIISEMQVFAFSAISMLFYGAGMSLASVGITIFAKDVSSPGRYDKSLQQLQAANSIGAFCFSTVPGMIADHTGSYIPAYIFVFAFTLIGTLSQFFAYRNIERV